MPSRKEIEENKEKDERKSPTPHEGNPANKRAARKAEFFAMFKVAEQKRETARRSF